MRRALRFLLVLAAYTSLASSDDQNQASDDQQHSINGAGVCFDHIGCFSMEPPWFSPLRPFPPPKSPYKDPVNVKFYSRPDPNLQFNLTVYPEVDLQGAPFDHSKVTAVICHAYATTDDEPPTTRLKDAYLSAVDGNVFVIDWSAGATDLNYFQSVSNARVVGRIVGRVLNHLIGNYGLQPGRIHLFGYSLGAQAIAYVAKEVPGVGRLTAMDPVKIGFEGYDKIVRLDKSDALFVDVIHTNSIGFGTALPVGHVDFYVNGGVEQPGCFVPDHRDLPPWTSAENAVKLPFALFREFVSCNHRRSEEFITEAYRRHGLTFLGRRFTVPLEAQALTHAVTNELITNYEALHEPCTEGMCVRFGLDTEKTTLRGTFIMTTRSRPPYLISEPKEWGNVQSEQDLTRSLNELGDDKMERKEEVADSVKDARSVTQQYSYGNRMYS